MKITIQIVLFIFSNIICPIILTLITLHINKRMEKKKKLREEVYEKFFSLYMSTHHGRAYNFSDLENKVQKAFIKIMNESTQYVETVLANLFYEFIIRIPRKEEEQNISTLDVDKADKIFNEICDYIFIKFKHNWKISRKQIRKLNKYYKEREMYDLQDVFCIKEIGKRGEIIFYD